MDNSVLNKMPNDYRKYILKEIFKRINEQSRVNLEMVGSFETVIESKFKIQSDLYGNIQLTQMIITSDGAIAQVERFATKLVFSKLSVAWLKKGISALVAKSNRGKHLATLYREIQLNICLIAGKSLQPVYYNNLETNYKCLKSYGLDDQQGSS